MHQIYNNMFVCSLHHNFPLFFFFLFSISFSFVWVMCIINVTDCESLWVMDSQNKKSKGQYCPCLNIFLMKISGVCLSFSRGWLTKEWEREVHLGVPLYIHREREREIDIYCWNQDLDLDPLHFPLKWRGSITLSGFGKESINGKKRATSFKMLTHT